MMCRLLFVAFSPKRSYFGIFWNIIPINPVVKDKKECLYQLVIYTVGNSGTLYVMEFTSFIMQNCHTCTLRNSISTMYMYVLLSIEFAD